MIETIYAWVQDQITQNDVFAGLVGGSIIMSLLYASRSVPSRIWAFIKWRYTCQLMIFSEDEAFDWVSEWLSHLPYTECARRLRLSTTYASGLTRSVDDDEGGPHWMLAPGIGAHWFVHNGRLVWINRSVNEPDASGRRRESIEMRTIGRSSRLLHAIVREAREMRGRTDTLDVYVYDEYWRRVSRRMPRPLDTVILPQDQISRIVDDANWFIQSNVWYVERGVPYRRGYLFFGPPGCGKTSLVIGLASHLRRPIFMLNLPSLASDSDLLSAVQGIPTNAIALIEDIDAARASAKRVNGKNQEKAVGISQSGLLNAIDGAATPDGRILIMTSNHPENVDPALFRPGRVDLKEEIGPLDQPEARRLFLNFFPGEVDAADQFAHVLAEPVPAAELQQRFIRFADDTEALLRPHEAEAA